MSKTAAELIAHLEAGGLIARGEPDHAEFLRFEIYGEQRSKHLGAYGWGSALGRVESRLLDVLRDPYEWVCVPLGVKPLEHKSAAKPLLAELGEYVNYDWHVTASDQRPVNTRVTGQPADKREMLLKKRRKK